MDWLTAAAPSVLQGSQVVGSFGVATFVVARRGLNQQTVLALVALFLILMSLDRADDVISGAFETMSKEVVFFAAVAIASARIEDSQAFEWGALRLGRLVGWITLRWPAAQIPAVVLVLVTLTFSLGLGLHSSAAVFIMVPVTVKVCGPYRIPACWLLCAQALAANLGAACTPWADTTSTLVAHVWSLDVSDMVWIQLPFNLLLLFGLCLGVWAATARTAQVLRIEGLGPLNNPADIAFESVLAERQSSSVTVRRISVLSGSAAMLVIAAAGWFNAWFAALAILISLFPLASDEEESAIALPDIAIVAALFAAFVAAQFMGETVAQLYTLVGRQPWGFAALTYVGAMFTHSAAWAAAAAQVAHQAMPAREGAWLFSGALATGGAAMLTSSASSLALWAQSRRFCAGEVTLRRYAVFAFFASGGVAVAYALGGMVILGLT